MRFLLAALLILAPLSAQAQFKSYFDISALKIAALSEPDWVRKQEENRVRYMCTKLERCALPTGIDIKGIVRAESLPAAFESGELSPARQKAIGEARATLPGQKFVSAEPVTVAGRKGIHMEAQAESGGTMYFVTRWIGEGNRMLEVKVIARDLALGRQLIETASKELVPQVFAP
jgi:hypothetical protein